MKRASSNILDWFQRSWGWWALFAVWILVFSIATSIPARDLPPGPFPNFDKIVHFTAFLVGATVLFPAIHLMRRWPILYTGLATFILVVIFGIVDEHKQLFVPGRSGGDWADIAANSLGAAVGVIMLLMIYGYSLAGKRAKARGITARRD